VLSSSAGGARLHRETWPAARIDFVEHAAEVKQAIGRSSKRTRPSEEGRPVSNEAS
jgi:hypothetical protein